MILHYHPPLLFKEGTEGWFLGNCSNSSTNIIPMITKKPLPFEKEVGDENTIIYKLQKTFPPPFYHQES